MEGVIVMDQRTYRETKHNSNQGITITLTALIIVM